MNEINCQLIVCILVVLICLRTELAIVRVNLDSYMWTLDKQTASLSAAI